MHIKLAVPPIDFEPYFKIGADGSFRGHFVKVLDELSKEMGFTYTMERSWQFLPQYVRSVAAWPFDICLVGLHYAQSHNPALEFKQFVYTSPLYSSHYSALVKKTVKPVGFFRMFHPFEKGLWFAVLGCIILAALILNAINMLAPSKEFQDAPPSLWASPPRILKSIYHMCATLLEGEDYEWTTWPERILRLFLLLFTMILVASYTANLAAFFTTPGFSLHGPADMAELGGAKACFTTDVDPSLLDQVSGHVMAGSPQLSLDARQGICHEAVRNGTVDVWMADKSSLNHYLMSNCEDLAMVETIALSPIHYGLAARVGLEDFAANLSVAITDLTKQPAYLAMLQESFSLGRPLPEHCDTEVSETAPVTLQSMGGLFVIVFTGFGFALLLAGGMAVRKRLRSSSSKVQDFSAWDFEHGMTDGELIRLVLRKVNHMSSQLQEDVARREQREHIS